MIPNLYVIFCEGVWWWRANIFQATILRYHIVKGKLSQDNLNGTLESLDGTVIITNPIKVGELRVVTINEANIVDGDHWFNKGVIHVISKVSNQNIHAKLFLCRNRFSIQPIKTRIRKLNLHRMMIKKIMQSSRLRIVSRPRTVRMSHKRRRKAKEPILLPMRQRSHHTFPREMVLLLTNPRAIADLMGLPAALAKHLSLANLYRIWGRNSIHKRHLSWGKRVFLDIIDLPKMMGRDVGQMPQIDWRSILMMESGSKIPSRNHTALMSWVTYMTQHLLNRRCLILLLTVNRSFEPKS